MTFTLTIITLTKTQNLTLITVLLYPKYYYVTCPWHQYAGAGIILMIHLSPAPVQGLFSSHTFPLHQYAGARDFYFHTLALRTSTLVRIRVRVRVLD
jgi:hypothetical protein